MIRNSMPNDFDMRGILPDTNPIAFAPDRPHDLPPRLLTPGPMALSEAVKRPMMTDLGSRGSDILRLTSEVRGMLTALANGGGTHDAVLLQGSGTFAIEAAIGTFCSPYTRVLVIVNGIYGERAVRILRSHGVPCNTITCDANVCPDLDTVAERLNTGGNFTHLLFVHCETTTGILNPLHELCALARQHGLITIVDAMSSFGGEAIDLCQSPVDILVGSGNKCVEAPPGIAFAIVRRRLLKTAEGNSLSYCLDLHDQWSRFTRTGEWRCTPPTHVLQALHAALSALCTETVPARKRRYEKIRDRVEKGLIPLGFVPVVALGQRAAACTAFTCPAWTGRESAAFDAYCDALHDARLHIYAKMHEPTASFRIGCIGAIEDSWIDALIDATAQHMQTKG